MRWTRPSLRGLGTLAATSATSTAEVETCFQKRKRPVRVWSRARLRAMRMSQVARRAVGAEGGAGGPGAQEGLLGEGLGGVAVAQGGEEEAEDARLVEGDDAGEVVERGGAGLPHRG
jgi:hypothetical protein